MSIGIVKNPRSFLPEVEAYFRYFSSQGHHVEIVGNIEELENLPIDIAIVFGGIYPFWKSYKFPLVYEYNSLSTGKYVVRIKDIFKRILNQGNNYVFLNDYVRKRMFYSKNTGILRGMGYFDEYLRSRSGNHLYDIVYSGTIERPGLREEIERLAGLGFRVAIIGTDKHLGNNIESLGTLTLEEVYEVYSRSKYGLNFTPDIYPYNCQDSTKVIEYCAAGLKVITNKYEWLNNFEKEYGARFLDIQQLQNVEDATNYEYVIPDVSNLKWNCVIERSGIEILLEKVINEKLQ